MTVRPQVLIVGAGPTGLLLACCLYQLKVPFRLIDKKAGPTQTSNAIAIQSRTLEILDDLGLVDRFLDKGIRTNTLKLHAGSQVLAQIELKELATRYPFALILEQNVTEGILSHYLQENEVVIERETELLDLVCKKDKVEVLWKNPMDRHTKQCFEWLVACDGAHSTVRHLLKIPFQGKTLPQPFVIADLKLAIPQPDDTMDAFVSRNGIAACFPLPHQRTRFVASLPYTPDNDSEIIYSDTDIEKLINERTSGQHTSQAIEWVSTFHINSRITQSIQHQRIFLAGDAAHIHSPMGGQGMNTGMQDAYNLGWKLATLTQENLPSKQKKYLIESYHIERYPALKETVTKTDFFTKLLLKKNHFIAAIRNQIIKTTTKCPKITKKMSNRIAQLSIQYTDSPLIDFSHIISPEAPQPGSRAPNIMLPNQQHLTDLLRGLKHHILIFSGESTNNIQAIKDFANWLQTHYPKISIHLFAKQPVDFLPFTLDEDCSLHRALHIKKTAVLAYRPDNYLGYLTPSLDKKRLDLYLKQFFAREMK